MKRTILFTLALIFFASSVYAQEPNMSVYGRKGSVFPAKVGKFFKKLRYSDELTVGVGLDNRSLFSFGNIAVAYHRFGDTVSLGLGTGLIASRTLDEVHYFYQTDNTSEYYSMSLILPLFVRAKASPWQFGRWRPFARLDVGGAIPLGKDYSGGLFFAPALGSNFRATGKTNLFFALSTLWMQTGYCYDEHLGQPAEILGSSALTLMLHAGLDF